MPDDRVDVFRRTEAVSAVFGGGGGISSESTADMINGAAQHAVGKDRALITGGGDGDSRGSGDANERETAATVPAAGADGADGDDGDRSITVELNGGGMR